MTGQELLDYVRADVLRDAALPYLWSDALILRYLSEAESQFARKTYALLDDSKTVTTVIGTQKYALPVGTIHVMSAAMSGSSTDLHDYTRRFIPSNLAVPGTPTAYTCDEASARVKYIRLYPTPDAVATVNLRVARLPASAIDLYSEPEIPDEYHLDLAEYVAWKCLIGNDVDGSNIGAAERHKVDWNLKVSDAKREYYRIRTGNNASVARSWTGKRNK